MTVAILTVRTGAGDGGDQETTSADLSARCWLLGCLGLEERAGSIRATFGDLETARAAALVLSDHVTEPPRIVADPLAGWVAPMTPTRAGPFHILPAGVATTPAEEQGLIVTIDPGKAFGTGSHPSTRAALELLGRGPVPRQVLDLGTGTGVLAIAAARLGAVHVLAIDIDPDAIDVAIANIMANHVEDVVRTELSPVQGIAGRFDLVLVNLTVDGHEALAPVVRALVAEPGAMIASGILSGDQERRVERCHHPAVVTDRILIDDWVGLRLERYPAGAVEPPGGSARQAR